MRDAAVTLLIAVIARQALGQVSGSVALVSDYRFRGVSLSDGRPAFQLNLEYDHDSGWYGGGFASTAQMSEDEPANAQLLAYTGYARRLNSGWGWELGATKSTFLQAGSYNYVELFAGLSVDNLSARLYFSPNYFGRDGESMYGEFNGTYPLRQHLRLLGHIGFLRPLSGREDASNLLFDTRLGVSAGIDHWTLQVAWVHGEEKHEEYRYQHQEYRHQHQEYRHQPQEYQHPLQEYRHQDHHRNTGILTVSYAF